MQTKATKATKATNKTDSSNPSILLLLPVFHSPTNPRFSFQKSSICSTTPLSVRVCAHSRHRSHRKEKKKKKKNTLKSTPVICYCYVYSYCRLFYPRSSSHSFPSSCENQPIQPEENWGKQVQARIFFSVTPAGHLSGRMLRIDTGKKAKRGEAKGKKEKRLSKGRKKQAFLSRHLFLGDHL